MKKAFDVMHPSVSNLSLIERLDQPQLKSRNQAQPAYVMQAVTHGGFINLNQGKERVQISGADSNASLPPAVTA